MMKGTVRFNGHDLGRYGTPSITMTRTPDPQSPDAPDRWIQTITLEQEVPGKAPSTIWARLDALDGIFRQPEGIFELWDENGPRMQLRVKVGQNNLPEAIERRLGKWQVTLQGWTHAPQTDEAQGSYTPQDSPTPILLHNIRGYSETVNTQRSDDFRANRSRTTKVTTFSCRVLCPDSNAFSRSRLVALQAEKKKVEGLQGKQGTFRWQDEEALVQITSIQCQIDNALSALELQIQMRQTALPGDSEVEVTLNVDSSREQCDLGEGRTRITGEVRADSRTIAEQKIAAIQAQYDTATRTLLSSETRDTYLDGEDSGDDATWTGLTFTMEFRDQAILSFTGTVDTSEDQNGCRVTYSGEVKATDLNIAIAKARALGADQDGLSTQEQLTIDQESACEDDTLFDLSLVSENLPEAAGFYQYDAASLSWERKDGKDTYTIEPQNTRYVLKKTTAGSSNIILTSSAGSDSPAGASWPEATSVSKEPYLTATHISVRYSFTYVCSSTRLRGEFRQTTDKSPFAENFNTVSGTMSAPTYAEAEAAAVALIPDDVSLTRDNISRSNAQSGNEQQWISLSFDFGWLRHKDQSEMQWSEAVNTDYSSMTATRTISGNVYASTSSHGKSLIGSLAATIAGLPTRKNITENWQNVDSVDKIHLRSLSFSYSWTEGLTGTLGHDVIEAKWRLSRTGQVDHAAVTETVCGDPVMQSGMGFNTGRLVASGSIKSRVQATGVAWGQGKRSAAASAGGQIGAEDPPQENVDVAYPEFHNADPAYFVFSFTYSFRYAAGLKGLWSAGSIS